MSAAEDVSTAEKETAAFLDALADLAPVTPGDVLAVRDRRRLLASMFDSGPAEVARSDDTIARVPVARYLPPDADLTSVVFYVHGGGWVAGDLITHDGFCRRLAFESGLPLIAIDYRRPPERRHPAAVEDVLAVVEASSGDAARVFLAGDSSGAHVAVEAALRYALASEHSTLAGLLLVQPACDPQLSSPSWTTLGTGYFLTAAAMRWYWDNYLDGEWISPLWERELAELPPTYIFTTSLDPSAEESRRFGTQLEAAGVSVVARHVAGLPHGCLTVPDAFPSAHVETRAAARWMTTQPKRNLE